MVANSGKVGAAELDIDDYGRRGGATAARTHRNVRAAVTAVLYRAGGVALAVGVWWVCSLFLSNKFEGFAPVPTLAALRRLLVSETFHLSVFSSLERLAGGLSVAVLVGVPVGILTGYFRRVNQLTYVLFQFLRMISPLSWVPVAIILFGVGAEPVYFLVAVAAVWPVVINTAHGVQKIDRSWVMVAKTLGGEGPAILRHILIPAVLPDILTGIRLALGVAWIVIVPAEMLGVASGLGYSILNFRDNTDYASLMAVVLVIGLIGYLSDSLVRYLQERCSWRV